MHIPWPQKQHQRGKPSWPFAFTSTTSTSRMESATCSTYHNHIYQHLQSSMALHLHSQNGLVNFEHTSTSVSLSTSTSWTSPTMRNVDVWKNPFPQPSAIPSLGWKAQSMLMVYRGIQMAIAMWLKYETQELSWGLSKERNSESLVHAHFSCLSRRSIEGERSVDRESNCHLAALADIKWPLSTDSAEATLGIDWQSSQDHCW